MSDSLVKCPKCAGVVWFNEYGVGQCRSCLRVFETRQEFERQTENSKTRYGRWQIWFEAQVRRGKRRHKELAASPRYLNALVKLRSKYNVPSAGFSTQEECSAWELWLCQESDDAIGAGKRPDRWAVNRLHRDCEKLAKRFLVVGGWEMARRHMLYDKAITDFAFGEGWRIEYVDNEPRLVVTPAATQETIRHARRLLRLEERR
jgi:hypothetical protein